MTEAVRRDAIPAAALPILGRPGLTPVTAGFWNAAREGRLEIQRCGSCGVHRHPPTAACYACQSLDWSWSELPGTGAVFTFIWVDAPMDEALAAITPYNACVIELDGVEGDPVRMVSNVVGVDRESLQISLPVQVCFERVDGGAMRLPIFEPRAAR